MKIQRLLTISQFIELIKTKRFHEFENINKAEKYKLIIKYDQFLKQPLTKEMFVGNEIIFEGNWQGTANNMLGDDTYQISEGYNLIEFWEDGDINYMDYKNYEYWVKTLHDLAEATKGKLKLKNIEL